MASALSSAFSFAFCAAFTCFSVTFLIDSISFSAAFLTSAISFSAAFLLASQCKGAVALGGYFIALNYYIIAEFGPKWYDKLDVIVTNEHALIKRRVFDFIKEAFKQFVWGINQPAGNRSYQSPFTNVSYYDHTYFNSLFSEFYYPDGTQPEWKAIDTLQRLFMKWFNKLRLTQVLTFPVNISAA